MPSPPSSSFVIATADEDVVEELIMIQQYVFMPRACYTQDWAMKYYARVRDGFLARARAMTAAQVGLMGKRRIESFVSELRGRRCHHGQGACVRAGIRAF